MTRTVGAYELLERIAVGGVAEIFLAKKGGMLGFEQNYAVKLLMSRYATSDEHRQMLIDEARLTAQLDHPNIVKVHDLGEEDGQLYVVMEYVRGVDLNRLLSAARAKGEPLPFDVAIYIAMEICAGLHHAHTLKGPEGKPLEVVHRDISPQNVLIGSGGEVKLVDFGVAKAAVGGRIETKTGIIKGKFIYMAPEYAIGALQDARSDLFAVALCLYEMVTGRPAYDLEDPQELARAVKYATIPAAAELRPDLPAGLQKILDRALQQHPRDRYQSGKEMQEALAAFLASLAPNFTRDRLVPLVEAAETANLAGAKRANPTTQPAELQQEPLDDDFAEEATAFLSNEQPPPPSGRSDSAMDAYSDAEDDDAVVATAQLSEDDVRAAMEHNRRTFGSGAQPAEQRPAKRPVPRPSTPPRPSVPPRPNAPPPGEVDEATAVEETGPLKQDELAGFGELKAMREAGGAAEPEDEVAVLETMALNEEERGLPPVADDAATIDPDQNLRLGDEATGELDPAEEFADAATATDIDADAVRRDAIERDGQPNKPQILSQSGFQRFMSADEINAIRNQSGPATQPAGIEDDGPATVPPDSGPSTQPAGIQPAPRGADRPTMPSGLQELQQRSGPSTQPAIIAGDEREMPTMSPAEIKASMQGRGPIPAPDNSTDDLGGPMPSANAAMSNLADASPMGGDVMNSSTGERPRPYVPPAGNTDERNVPNLPAQPAEIGPAGQADDSASIQVSSSHPDAQGPDNFKDAAAGLVGKFTKNYGEYSQTEKGRRTNDAIIVAVLALIFVGLVLYILFSAD